MAYKKLVRIVESEGFVFARERGDHMVFTKPGVLRPVVIPRYDGLPVFIIKNILRTAGIGRERYFELLDDV
ncbi:MAG: type II toxin-antitoxin system HicA family toxin [Candidatus Acidiferrales bacterium]